MEIKESIAKIQKAEAEDGGAFYDGVSKINGIVARAKDLVDKRARAFAEEYYPDKFIYTMGSGASWGSAIWSPSVS